jgi:D-galactose 1-dehydrogenase
MRASGEDGIRIGVGIVGYGKIARDQHLTAIRENRRFFLHSVADPVGGPISVPHYTDVDSMLGDENPPDAVVICTPPQARFDIAQRVLQRDIPVLLEKPPCATLEEIESLRLLAQDGGITLFSAWHSQFAAAVGPAREWLKSRQAKSVRIDWREDVRVWHPNQEWIWKSGGFGVFDAGINALSIVTEILPGPLRLQDAVLSLPKLAETPVAAELRLADAMGADVSAGFDFLQAGPPTWNIEVATDEGQLQLVEGGGRLFIDGRELPVRPNREYPSLYRHFAELIETNRADVDVEPLRLVTEALRIGRRMSIPVSI